MRRMSMPVVILVAAAALGGCGQKGPLYRENPAASGPVGQNNSTETQSQRRNDRSTQAE